MKIKEILNRNRRDFDVDLECEHCGNIHKNVSCYDDNFFHTTVIPNISCDKCGKKASDNYTPLQTKYGEYEIV